MTTTSSATSTTSGYDAAGQNGKRRAASTILKPEDTVLNTTDRKRVVGAARDIRRNFPDAAWAIRKHLDFVSTFTFQARNADAGFNRTLEDWLASVSVASRFEVAGRRRLDRFFRLIEACRTVDGDCGVLKLSDGRVQGIEGDRVTNGATGPRTPDWYRPEQFTHGILASRSGAHQYYAICERSTSGTFTVASVVPAVAMIWYEFGDRFDQVRGISPIVASLNAWQDVYEARTYAILKAKIAQLFGLKITSQLGAEATGEPIGSITATTADTGETADAAGNSPSGYKVDFGSGPVLLDLSDEPGKDASFLENRTPPQEFQDFDQAVVASALKALDIPFSFYNESFTNFYGSRGALQHYLFSAAQKQRDHAELRDQWFEWRLAVAVANGELTLPSGMSLADVNWEWIPKGLPWWRPLEEVKAGQEAVLMGTASIPMLCRLNGDDPMEIARQQIEYEVAKRDMRIAAGLDAPAAQPVANTQEETKDENQL
jgi:capsid protein